MNDQMQQTSMTPTGAASALTDVLAAGFDECECLKYWPFDGDFGHPSDKILKDKIGIARKGGPCCECLTEIRPGERIRMIGAIFDDQMMSYRYCSACCSAMAEMWTGNWNAMDERLEVRARNEAPNVEVSGTPRTEVKP
ncbi:MAG: hypothetical protein Q7T94_11355 [Rugosibacter sp.]|nr:hypothetical protein [Rugosibacter sp.]